MSWNRLIIDLKDRFCLLKWFCLKKRIEQDYNHWLSFQMPKSSSKDDIYKYLTWYLLKVPKLFDELPQILSSLDAGEVIGTSFIQDTVMRDALDHIMSFLPTVQTKGNELH